MIPLPRLTSPRHVTSFPGAPVHPDTPPVTSELPAHANEGLHVLAKPVGAACNLDCGYCYYLDRARGEAPRAAARMSEAVLDAFVRKYVEANPFPVVEFVWHGGEPTLAGLDFFRRAVALQARYAGGKRIRNALQTNGTLLDDAWAAFLAEHGFLVGLSLDGPREVHDRYRLDRGARPTFDLAMRGLATLQRHGVEVNVLATVARDTARRPGEVYAFLRDAGVQYMQFIPVVERVGPNGFASPPDLSAPAAPAPVSPFTVVPEQYGTFLSVIFDTWRTRDIGRVFVMNFEWALNLWIGNPSPVCVFSEQCGRALALEHDGSVYACDHFVRPRHRLGDILEDELGEMVARSLASGFGVEKQSRLPRQCRRCPWLSLCHGECPKNRFATSRHGEPGLNYLCEGYKRFFGHIAPHLSAIATHMKP